jgi:hypothetical protein
MMVVLSFEFLSEAILVQLVNLKISDSQCQEAASGIGKLDGTQVYFTAWFFKILRGNLGGDDSMWGQLVAGRNRPATRPLKSDGGKFKDTRDTRVQVPVNKVTDARALAVDQNGFE